MPATHRCRRCAATYDSNDLAAGVTAGLASEQHHCVNGHNWDAIGMCLFIFFPKIKKCAKSQHFIALFCIVLFVFYFI